MACYHNPYKSLRPEGSEFLGYVEGDEETPQEEFLPPIEPEEAPAGTSSVSAPLTEKPAEERFER